MSTLIYRCPSCGAVHEVDESLVGDQVECRRCKRHFEAAVPVARPEMAEEGQKAEFSVTAGEGAVEDELVTVHPALIRRHPGQFLLACLGVAIGVAVLVLGATGSAILGFAAPAAVMLAVGAVILLVPFGFLLFWWLETRFARLVVTNRRSIFRRGIISRQTSEVRHEDVRNLKIDQSQWERMFGVGTISISSSGQDEMEIVARGIPNPEHIAAIIRDMQ